MAKLIPKFEISAFRENLINWWEENKRSYPWRNTRDSYHLLVAEIFLHRTRADQAVFVYEQFLKYYPTIQDAMAITQDDLAEIMHPLGLHWRVPLMHEMLLNEPAVITGVVQK
jgi:A/G-specific adenine glycosylase